MEFVKQYVVVAGLFLVIDSVWLRLVANSFYKEQLGYLLAKKPNIGAAAVFYVLYMVGILVFALHPALGNGSLTSAIWHGALLGLIMYATYDLTNQATIKDWPVKITVVDLVWGSFITSVVTTLGFVIFH